MVPEWYWSGTSGTRVVPEWYWSGSGVVLEWKWSEGVCGVPPVSMLLIEGVAGDERPPPTLPQ